MAEDRLNGLAFLYIHQDKFIHTMKVFRRFDIIFKSFLVAFPGGVQQSCSINVQACLTYLKFLATPLKYL